MLQEGHTESEAEQQTSIDETQEEEVEEVAEVSLNSVVGLFASSTMKVKGKIAQHEVVVMIDCGVKPQFYLHKIGSGVGITFRVYLRVWDTYGYKRSR